MQLTKYKNVINKNDGIMAKNQNQRFLGVIKTPPVKNEHVHI